jgi:hypothetical protein
VAVDTPQIIGQRETVAVWMGFFRDTEGNTLALMSEGARTSMQ